MFASPPQPLLSCSALLITVPPPHTAPPLSLRKLLRGVEALIDWRPGPQDAAIIIISASAAGAVKGEGRGGGRESDVQGVWPTAPCFVCPIVN